MSQLSQDLAERLDEKVTTFDLLRVLQAFAEISTDLPQLFVQLEQLFIRRIDQMTVDELTTCASGYSVSGYGTPYFSSLMEQGILNNIADFSTQSLKEVARGFIFS